MNARILSFSFSLYYLVTHMSIIKTQYKNKKTNTKYANCNISLSI